MTCYIDASTGDVYDHAGTVVGNLNEQTDWGQTWRGDYPNEALDVLRKAMTDTKPDGYNQALLIDMASENIEVGTPPGTE
jgi:hypothetical protein